MFRAGTKFDPEQCTPDRSVRMVLNGLLDRAPEAQPRHLRVPTSRPPRPGQSGTLRRNPAMGMQASEGFAVEEGGGLRFGPNTACGCDLV